MDVNKRVGYEVKTLDHLIERKIISISIKNGMDRVTVMHGWIIAYLYDHEGQDVYQKDLEAQFCITKSTVTNILKLMEKKGYILRLPVEKDARLKKIVLTEKARSIQRQNYIDVNNMIECQLVKDVSQEDLATFLRVICKMKINMGEEC